MFSYKFLTTGLSFSHKGQYNFIPKRRVDKINVSIDPHIFGGGNVVLKIRDVNSIVSDEFELGYSNSKEELEVFMSCTKMADEIGNNFPA